MNVRVALLIAVGLIQLAVPGWMIFQQEQILRLGQEYKFETEPVDPYDLFRGRYVALRFKAADLKRQDDPDLPAGTKVYVAVKANEAGFAEVEKLSKTPLEGDNVFQATVNNWWDTQAKIHLDFPFERYYMEESLAPKAEAAYRAVNRRASSQKAWAVVRIRNGNAALADLFIDGQPIRDYLRDHPQPPK